MEIRVGGPVHHRPFRRPDEAFEVVDVELEPHVEAQRTNCSIQPPVEQAAAAMHAWALLPPTGSHHSQRQEFRPVSTIVSKQSTPAGIALISTVSLARLL